MKFRLSPFRDADLILSFLKDRWPLVEMIIFDLDETLVSHKSFVFDRLIRGLQEVAEVKLSDSKTQKLYQRIESLGTDGVLDFVNNELSICFDYAQILDFVRKDSVFPEDFFRDGALHLLRILDLNYQLRVCTNGNFLQQQNKASFLLQNVGIKVEFVFCSLGIPKPNPDCLLQASKHLARERVLFIGDSPSDASAASAAGVEFVHVNNFVLGPLLEADS